MITATNEHAAKKREIRAAVRERRAAMSAEDRATASFALTERLIALVRDRGARSISCFLSVPTEPDTGEFLNWASTEGIDVLLPVSNGDTSAPRLSWVRASDAGTEPGAHGIMEPRGERLPETAVGDVDLMLIPACAVDPRGARLGWGLGYYDRCLAALDRVPPFYAVVFDEDVLPELPTEPHDIPLKGYVTPSATVHLP